MGLASASFDLAGGLIIALFVWDRTKLNRRLADLSARWEQAQLENSRLGQALSARESGEMERFSRLEHDLRSTISVITGFSALIKESLEQAAGPSPLLLLKSANAIQESATKALRILEDTGRYGPTEERKGLVLEGNR
jgi:signal transduction histidine kinase